jgi:hypothetical protein
MAPFSQINRFFEWASLGSIFTLNPKDFVAEDPHMDDKLFRHTMFDIYKVMLPLRTPEKVVRKYWDAEWRREDREMAKREREWEKRERLRLSLMKKENRDTSERIANSSKKKGAKRSEIRHKKMKEEGAGGRNVFRDASKLGGFPNGFSTLNTNSFQDLSVDDVEPIELKEVKHMHIPGERRSKKTDQKNSNADQKNASADAAQKTANADTNSKTTNNNTNPEKDNSRTSANNLSSMQNKPEDTHQAGNKIQNKDGDTVQNVNEGGSDNKSNINKTKTQSTDSEGRPSSEFSESSRVAPLHKSDPTILEGLSLPGLLKVGMRQMFHWPRSGH